MIEFFGITGGMFFAVSGIPTAYRTYRAGFNSIPIYTAWLVWFGAVFTLLYLTLKNGLDPIIFLDYLVTISTWSVVLWYHYFPRA